MKKVLAITLMLVLLASAAMATETSWRILLKCDNGAGVNPGSGTYPGVYTTSVDTLDTQDGSPYNFGLDLPGATAIIASQVKGTTTVYGKDIQAPATSAAQLPKVWDLYIAGNTNYAWPQIRVVGYSVNNAFAPTILSDATAVKYSLIMVDNKDKAGAPANGTAWDIVMPQVHSTLPFWTSPVNLPAIALSMGSASALMTEGYHMQLVMDVVPEPSSLLALSAGLMGLAGFAYRRRR